MKLRLRFFGALIALLALTLYFAEGVWASMCPPQMEMVGVEEVSGQDASEHDCPMGVAHSSHSSSGESEFPEQSRSDAPVCPLGPMGLSGSCVAVSLPGTTAQMASSFPEGTLLSPSPDPARDLLLAATLFHPPRT